ncbi:MAG TPA: hypothetical protein VHH92_07845, partial [Actinomycetota bacterium]|nr:hypothetical protein [Actinomycetota bacterium]
WWPAHRSRATILFVSLGGFLFAGEPSAAGGELTGDRGRPGAPITVGPVRIRPAAGWRVAEQIPDPPQLRLTSGAAQLYMVIPPSQDATSEGLVQAYVEEALEPQARQLSVGSIEPVELPSGQQASLLAYLGTFEGVEAPLEGEVLAVVSPAGTPVVFDGWAPEGLWVGSREEVRTMVGTAEIP